MLESINELFARTRNFYVCWKSGLGNGGLIDVWKGLGRTMIDARQLESWLLLACG